MCVKARSACALANCACKAGMRFKQPPPRHRAFLKAKLRRDLVRCRDARACHSVVKFENPDPTTVKDVVDSGIIDWIRRLTVDAAELRILQPLYAGKMTVEALRSRIIGKRILSQMQSAMKKPARARGVDDKSRVKLHATAVAFAAQSNPVFFLFEFPKRDMVEVVDPELPGFPHKKMIEFGAIPVHVGDFVVRAGGDQQLVPVFGIEGRRAAQQMMMKRKSSLEPAGNLGMRALPASPLGQRLEHWQIVANAQLFKKEVCQWRR